ncbi:MAG: LysM peptidoglycan-binding domain-containing protein [Caldilineaceae bacterium]|nr:LysM peptidoglycan-binding domain-containing protein [Caldilineaceae bacterium]MBP8106035.1 LysM peptidoglycan-binding domain-containing protein [Caldilineaceae bacterium]MBP8121959.1 LysM peptidoglycan-binding domain-containing protein [Caldilineaceae bacterium]MBP9074626.1 LysM peptidoglycan-binding domain-containing protein [Caldilineaceae bacterium]
MNRRQLVFLILINALISTVIALAVAFAVDARRPDAEELAALYAQPGAAAPAAVILATSTPNPGLVPTFTPVPLATSVPAAAASDTSGGADGQIYVVEAGDSLGGISVRFGVTLDALMAANQLTNPDFVFVGQRLTIPTGTAAAIQPSESTPALSAPVPASPDGVIVGSVSGGGDLAAEQLLIVNDSDNAFNLQGWTLQISGGSGSGTPVYTFGSVPLFPGGSVRLHSISGVDTSVDLYWGQPAARLTPGAALTLINSQGLTVHTFAVP